MTKLTWRYLDRGGSVYFMKAAPMRGRTSPLQRRGALVSNRARTLLLQTARCWCESESGFRSQAFCSGPERHAGFENVINLTGGMLEWNEAVLPVER